MHPYSQQAAMNHIENLQSLNNRYLALRHGKSRANEDGIIVSSPEIGTADYGLIDEGRREVRISMTMALEEGVIDENAIIYASDFLRTRDTAEEAKTVTGIIEPVHLTKELRERFFGDLEGKSNKHYGDVWRVDKVHPHHKFNGVESAEEVQTRTTSLIAALETLYTGQTIILASHGDALQILETGFRRISPKYHRDIPHLQTAELRELTLTTGLDPKQLEKAASGSTLIG